MQRPLFLFAHGAGAPSTSTWMLGWQRRLATLGRVVAFDYPYMAAGRRAPDPLPKLIAAHRDALHQARASHAGPVVLAGKSMGGRVGCHVALEEDVDALVCFGYPLKGAGKSGKLRDRVLLDLETPVLFIQGTRDPLCPLELLDDVREKMSARSELYVVQGGNHSLEVTKKELARSDQTADDVDLGILRAVEHFVGDVTAD